MCLGHATQGLCARITEVIMRALAVLEALPAMAVCQYDWSTWPAAQGPVSRCMLAHAGLHAWW